MMTVVAALVGWVVGLFVGMMVLLVVAPPTESKERAMNGLGVALVLGCCAALGILLAWSLTT